MSSANASTRPSIPKRLASSCLRPSFTPPTIICRLYSRQRMRYLKLARNDVSILSESATPYSIPQVLINTGVSTSSRPGQSPPRSTNTWTIAQIEKLRIQGVRSFSNTSPSHITFRPPLTVIVGFNGSGKTTIIECLKFATTGQLPPNSKGGAFIHDPNLAGEKQVQAQVRLQFSNSPASNLVVSRSVEVSVNKSNGKTQRSVECMLSRVKDGERSSISTRVAELDKLIPQLLGVSAAILESVIFCHQDESLWPMSEPAALKKKFDEIFEAQKYAKALENLKTLRKTQQESLKALTIHEANFKSTKDKAVRVQQKTQALEADIESLHEKITLIDQDLEAAITKKDDLEKQKTDALTTVQQLRNKTVQANYTRDNLNDLKTHLEELTESDDWLETTLAQYDERMAQYAEEEQNLLKKYTDLKEELNKVGGDISEKQAERGRHQAKKDNYEAQLESRVQLIKESARQHAMRGYDGDLSQHQIREFVGRMQTLSRDKDRELESIRNKTDGDVRDKQASIEELEGHRTSHTQKKVTAKQSIAMNDKRSREKQSDIDKISMDEGTKSGLEASLKDLQDRLRRMNTDFEAAEWDANLKVENSRLRELKDESVRLRNELLQNNKLVEDRTRLDMIKREAKDRQGRLDTTKATHNEQFTSIIGPNWSVDTLEVEFQAVLDQQARVLSDSKSQQEKASRAVDELEYKLKTNRDLLKRKKDEMQKCLKGVLDSIPDSEGKPLSSIDDYQKELDQLEEYRNEAQKNLDSATYVTQFYGKCKATAQNQNACATCMRSFKDKQEQSSAVDRLNKLLEKYAKEKLEVDLKEAQEDFQVAHAAHPQYDAHNKLSIVEIPALQKDIQKLEGEKANLVAHLESKDNLVAEAEAANEAVMALAKTVSLISRYNSEISKYEDDITRFSSQQKLSGSSMSSDEIGQQSTACDEKIRALETKLQKMTGDKDQARSAIINLERDSDAVTNRLTIAQHQLDKKQGLLSAIEELRNASAQLRDTIQQADIELENLAPQISQARAELEEVQRHGRTKEKTTQLEQQKFSQTVDKFKVIDESIAKYIRDRGPEMLDECQFAIEELERKKNNIEKDIKQVTKSANDVKARIADSDKTRRSINDNLRYRKFLRELEILNHDIADLNSRNVEKKLDSLQHDFSKAVKQVQNIVGERGPIVGEIKGKDDELVRLMKEWDTEFKDAAEEYRKCHIKVEATKATIDDLAKYGHALEAAIMKFHTLKMDEINLIANELWQETYQGTDVDGIMIRSENENTSSKRNYHYRLVMDKQGNEMDMRGRCSAGQRVLACIIIRLALAECFGTNCGIIALDEPTTNLDRDNIKMLAYTLNRIIKARRHQANFQLIIITHDEEFLRYMNCTDFTDNYWRVSRDDKQKSEIKKMSLSDFM